MSFVYLIIFAMIALPVVCAIALVYILSELDNPNLPKPTSRDYWFK